MKDKEIKMNIIETIKEKLGDRIIIFFEKNPQRYYIDISTGSILESAKIMFNDMGCRFAIASGVDTKEGIEILYHFSHDKTGKMITLRVLLKNKEKPEIESISRIIKGAEWIEREIWEMLGVNFRNHPGLKRLLLAPDWPEGKYPLRRNTE
ncbi:MAG: NADH-quinone oxidoreductase subunit C [Elusimicrobia bacterium]|nr:NADH-quinone oxidoreductase subunit C [Elusimicrobiota bacterium]